MFFLQRQEMDEFVPNLCHQRWPKSHLPADLQGDTIQAKGVEVASAAPILSQAEKYRKAHNVTEKIAEMLSEKPMAVFETFMNVLRECERAVEYDQLFAIEILNENSKGHNAI